VQEPLAAGAWARSIPKAEIHLHLEGSVDPPTLVDLIERRGGRVDRAGRERIAALYTHRDFRHFLENFRTVCGFLTRPEDYARVASALSDRLRDETVRYAEVFCSPGVFEPAGLPADEVLDAVSDTARRRAAAGGPRLRFLLDGVRQLGIGPQEKLVELAARSRRYDVIGIGLGGDEKALPASHFAGAYREARRLGLHTTVHAGEFDGPRSVRQALESLGVERIGHGVRAAEDEGLVRDLAVCGVPLECCPTSNLKTGVVAAWADHPLPRLLAAGVRVTINSDDPALFGTSLVGEWEAARARLGLSAAAVFGIGLQTAAATFLPPAEKDGLMAGMRAAAARQGIAP
jgi:adenosine deaminase